ncbi:MAG TPA: glycerophosphodiester phosphodiesterase family protein [Saprospiraceae bacterium]|nr:glycerophosphodiester phosphodiesterase family protein [Saprospiraceae bacterium]
MKSVLSLCSMLLLFACDNINASKVNSHGEASVGTDVLSKERPATYLNIAEGELPALMQPGTRLMPLISAHRGGRDIPGYPENSLEVFQYVVDSIPAMLECDINMTSDGVLILMHDNSLDRTTTGNGAVRDKTWEQMSELKLVDDFGKRTGFSVPTLEQTLQWARGKAILSLDVKRGVPFKNVIDLVEEYEMEDYVVVITYNVNDALSVHRLNKDLMISVSIRNQEEWLRMKNSGIPYDRMVAFTGTRLSPKSLFETLHEENIPAILGTLGNLDQQAAAQGDSRTYGKFLDLGADILATDRPLEAGKITEAYRK